MRKRVLLFVGCVAVAGSLFAIDLELSPTDIVWTNQCWLGMSITNITVGGYVDLRLYVDVNGDGVVNGNDYLLTLFEADDGDTNYLGAETFVDDKDGTVNGAVETAVALFGVSYNALHTVGDYIWEAVEIDEFDNPLGTDTVAFAVSQPESSVWISGRVCDYVSGDPVPGAFVEMEYFSDTVGLAPSVWADENGEFTVYLPEGISTNNVGGVLASARGMLSVDENPYSGKPVSGHFFNSALSIGENTVPDLYVVPAIRGDELYRVRGTTYRVESTGEGYETNVISGVMVSGEMEDEDSESFSWDISDENGEFSLVLPGSSGGMTQDIWCEEAQLNLRGLVGTSVEVDVTGTVSGVQVFLHPAEALARGWITDAETGSPLTGVEVFYEASSNNYSGTAYTLTNGMYEIGLMAGNYDAECARDSLEHRHYVAPSSTNGLEVTQGTVLTDVDFEAERGYLITGHVYDTNYNPLTDGEMVLMRGSNGWEEWVTDTDVRFDGYYMLLSSTGSVYVRTEDFGDSYIDLFYSNRYICALSDLDPLTVTINGLDGVDFYLPTGARLEGTVQYEGLQPAQWLRVDALIRNESNEWVCVGGGNTDWDGEFGFAVPTGSDVYLRTAVSYGWSAPRTWYGNSCSSDAADSLVNLITGATYNNLDIAIFPGYEVHGVVLDQNSMSPISGALITAFDITSNRYDTVYTSADGGYNSLYVPTNTGLAFYAGANGYQGEFFDNVYDPADVQGVWTSAYNHVNVSFTLYASDDDTDGDGLADYQEDSVPDGIYDPGSDFSNINNPDTDSDGVGDKSEYIAGTDPQDSESLFQIIGGSVTPTQASLAWSSVAGRLYTLQVCTNLVEGIWSNVYSVTATGPVVAVTNDSPGDAAFLRVEVSSP